MPTELTERELLLAYIGLLIEQIHQIAGLASAHGWRGNQELADQGDAIGWALGRAGRASLANEGELALAKWRASREEGK